MIHCSVNLEILLKMDSFLIRYAPSENYIVKSENFNLLKVNCYMSIINKSKIIFKLIFI